MYYKPIIKPTNDQIVNSEGETEVTDDPEEEKVKEEMVFIQYRGKLSEKLHELLLRIKVK